MHDHHNKDKHFVIYNKQGGYVEVISYILSYEVT